MTTPDEPSPVPIPPDAPAWAATLRRLADHLSCDFGGGPRPWRFAWVINFQKGGTLPFLGLLMLWYRNSEAAAWIYLALHGGYGLIWLMKDLAFPDPAWRRWITVGGGLNVFFGLLAWVLVVRLAVDLADLATGLPAARARLVLPLHPPVPGRLGRHDRRRRAVSGLSTRSAAT